MKSAGLILAAGESTRMGFPKALLQYRGETFLDRLVRLFSNHCEPVIVVLGAGAGEIRNGTKLRSRGGHDSSPLFVVNNNFRSGQTSSMQCGLRAVPEDADGVLFTLVDHPAVEASTIEALAPSENPALLRVPRYQGKRGHPIWFGKELIPEFLALPEDGRARDVVQLHADRTEFLDLDDPGIVADIDDLKAYHDLDGVDA